MKQAGKTIVIGHRNPDTDSICSAIAYARLKTKVTGKEHIPGRAGAVSPETKYVLDYFGVEAPTLFETIGTQVKDIEFNRSPGVDHNISLKKAWSLMKEHGVVTLPITQDGKLEGLITMGDIANSYMNVYDNHILAEAKTPYSNIIETLEGEMLVGDPNALFDKGNVLVAAANPDLMENYIKEHDLVIQGNRYESQLCAIEMNADCIVVSTGAPVSLTIKKLAAEKGCAVISTPYDTFTASRLINQSMPIRHFMKTGGLIKFSADDYVHEIKEIMAKERYRGFPVLDENGDYYGMISRRNLLGMQRRQVILVDHNERSQAVEGIENTEIVEIIDHHRLAAIETVQPVYFRNQPWGCTATIIYRMYKEEGMEPDAQTAGLLLAAIISDTLLFRSPTCTYADREAARILAELAGVEPERLGRDMFVAGSDLKGKTPRELFYQDYKVFDWEGATVGIGQISSMDEQELLEVKEKLLPYMQKLPTKHATDMFCIMLTTILAETSEVICDGQGTLNLLKMAFPEAEVRGNSIILPGVVSRKKQLIPALMDA
ncbi:MAG: putative manganese-dependent inorganic diphosphatase [Lachnospiraceae bacterium]|nr:putative manganese-dependent inorganic diphosphatase [Lachnospiraceae bacterium]